MRKTKRAVASVPPEVESRDDESPYDPSEVPVSPDSEPSNGAVSVDAEHLRDRMKLAAKPNAGEPLARRNRSKAGRKG